MSQKLPTTTMYTWRSVGTVPGTDKSALYTPFPKELSMLLRTEKQARRYRETLERDPDNWSPDQELVLCRVTLEPMEENEE